jgi:quercetin dioxygenase-like cupin family protein
MRWRWSLGACLIVAALGVFADWAVRAQGTATGPVRTVLAAGRVDSVLDRYLRLEQLKMQPGTSASYGGGPGTIYVASGQVKVSIGADSQMLREGEGSYLPAGANALVTAGTDGPVVLLHFMLAANADINKVVWSGQFQIAELHRMSLPAAVLKPGPYEFSMLHVTAAAGASTTPPHMRSAAALYYVLADGLITIWPSKPDGTISGAPHSELRVAGSIQEEPYGFVHGWGSPPGSAMRLLQANISQEGTREIIFVK